MIDLNRRGAEIAELSPVAKADGLKIYKSTLKRTHFERQFAYLRRVRAPFMVLPAETRSRIALASGDSEELIKNSLCASAVNKKSLRPLRLCGYEFSSALSDVITEGV